MVLIYITSSENINCEGEDEDEDEGIKLSLLYFVSYVYYLCYFWKMLKIENNRRLNF